MGPNGAGKSTLLKLMMGELSATDGMVKRHQHLRIGWYHQHLTGKCRICVFVFVCVCMRVCACVFGEEGR